MTSKLGVYWSVMHRRAQDYEYFKQLQPSVFKIMDGGPNDYAWARENLPNSLIVARDWALSEQHFDMLKDPIGTGQRHAQEWHNHANRLGFDRAKTLILGINEPRVWEPGVPEALRQYTIALCDRATELNLRVGAMQLSVGWPANKGPDTPPDWSPFHGVDNAIRRNNGALVAHEYWADRGPFENWGWWAGRVLKCPWQVPIVIGECGIDMYVKDGSVPHASRGWRGRTSPEDYAGDLASYTDRMGDDIRFLGCAVFASDFASHEWFSFDIEPAYQAILDAPIHDDEPDMPPVDTNLPFVPNEQPQPAIIPVLAHPIQDPAKRIISQRFGENPADYARFGMAGHTGIDFAVPVGTVVCAVDGGIVQEAGELDDYGTYIKLRHPWGESVYAHLSRIRVDQGMVVGKGEPIALSGNTGNSTGPHLHFAIRIYPYKRGAPYDGYSDPQPHLETISAPPQPKPINASILQLIKEAAAEFGLDWRFLAALAWYESSWMPTATSPAGAMGIMQIMPATWAEWSAKVGATNPYDDRDNIRTGAKYLVSLLKTLNGNEWKAVAAYNFGIGNILNGIEPPPETEEHAHRVIKTLELLEAMGV